MFVFLFFYNYYHMYRKTTKNPKAKTPADLKVYISCLEDLSNRRSVTGRLIKLKIYSQIASLHASVFVVYVGRRSTVQPKLQVRVLVLVPSPHDTLQDDQPAHAESSEKKIMRPKLNT